MHSGHQSSAINSPRRVHVGYISSKLKSNRRNESYDMSSNKPKTSLPFFVWLLAYVCAWAWKLCAIRCNAHQLSNLHSFAASKKDHKGLYMECAWKYLLPMDPLSPQSLSRLPGNCRQNPSVLLLFLLSGSPTVGEKNIRELWSMIQQWIKNTVEVIGIDAAKFLPLSQTCRIAKQNYTALQVM